MLLFLFCSKGYDFDITIFQVIINYAQKQLIKENVMFNHIHIEIKSKADCAEFKAEAEL
jgi:hypothetical protein